MNRRDHQMGYPAAVLVDMTAVNHLVWDWNGTLLHDSDLIHLSITKAIKQLGYGTVTVEQSRILHVYPFSAFYQRLAGRSLTTAEMQEVDQLFHEIYHQNAHQLALMAGARKSLDYWQQRGLTQSLLSLYLQDRLLAAIKNLEIADYFLRVDGRVQGMPGLKAESLAAHLAAMNLSGATTLVIGDTVDDAEAAKSVGAQSILLASGLQSRQTLETAGVPIIESLDALVLPQGSAESQP